MTMQLHITYNFADLNQALNVAQQTAEYADILGIGSLLLLKDGVKSIKAFKTAFPNKAIFAESRLSEKADQAVTMMAQAGANYVSVLACCFHSTIKKTVETAKSFDVKVALDLFNAPSTGQSAMDAKMLGVHLLLLHRLPHADESIEIEAEWHNVRDNSKLPIFITGKIDEENFTKIIALKPQGIMIGGAITQAENPAKAAHYFRSLM